MTVALVTGADRGLGAALAAALAGRGAEVWAACLEPAPHLEALGVRTVPGIDVSDDRAVAGLRDALGATELDLLISNAGVNESSGGPGDADTQAMAREFNVNVLGGVRVVRTVLPSIVRGGKIAFISTGRGAAVRQPDPARGMNYGYRMSKGALNVYGALLAQDLRAQEIAVVLLHPGSLSTDLMWRMAASGKSTLDPATLPSAEAAAPRVLDRIDALTLAESGRWIGLDGVEL